jgi:hypothetical protein
MRARIVEQLPTTYDWTCRVTPPKPNHIQADSHVAEHSTRYVGIELDEKMAGFDVDVM